MATYINRVLEPFRQYMVSETLANAIDKKGDLASELGVSLCVLLFFYEEDII